MKTIFGCLLALAVIVCVMTSCNQGDPQLGKASIDKVIGAMTLEEKANLAIGTGMPGFTGENAVIGSSQQLVNGAAGTTYAIPRLGIPAIVLADGPAGLRIDATREGDEKTYYCTHFPIGTLLASTWNQELVEEVGKAIGNEVHEYGVDVLLGPALNLHRHPLCGRNFEYYSEDPVVSGKIAAAYIRGVQSQEVGTSVKHFAANNQETNRNGQDVIASPRALRELYLKGFEIAIKESHPWTVMSSYNYINGTYTSESPELLTRLLRDEWGFTGMVMTDWFGGKDAVAQMKAGNDMLQPGMPKQAKAIIEGVRTGQLDEKVLDRNVKRILELILRSPHFKPYAYSDTPDLNAHAAITRQSATEGMVLLKNEDACLPLPQDVKRVALFGVTSYDFIAGGTGSGNVNRAYTVSLLDGLQNAGFQVDESLRQPYEQYVAEAKEKAKSEKKANPFGPAKVLPEWVPSAQLIARQAAQNQVALVTLGRTSGEFEDRTIGDFELNEKESALLSQVCQSFHAVGKKVVVILNVGGVLETASWKQLPDAILLAWQAGQEGGNSVADVLSGRMYPSGRLTMTFPLALNDVPSSANFPLFETPYSRYSIGSFTSEPKQEEETDPVRNVDYTVYEEDVFVGYRYFDTYGKDVSYPFGYGLSYTTFAYSEARISPEGDAFKVTVKVTNTGTSVGKEVVQLYVSAPANPALEKPEKELKAFAKTKELKPGESTVVTLFVKAEELASYDEKAVAWVTDAGTYQFKIGASSRDIKAELEADVKAVSRPTQDLLKRKDDTN